MSYVLSNSPKLPKGSSFVPLILGVLLLHLVVSKKNS